MYRRDIDTDTSACALLRTSPGWTCSARAWRGPWAAGRRASAGRLDLRLLSHIHICIHTHTLYVNFGQPPSLPSRRSGWGRVHVPPHAFIHIHLSLSLYIYICVYVYIYIYTYTYTYIHISMCVYIYIYVPLSISLSLSIYIYVCVYIYIHMGDVWASRAATSGPDEEWHRPEGVRVEELGVLRKVWCLRQKPLETDALRGQWTQLLRLMQFSLELSSLLSPLLSDWRDLSAERVGNSIWSEAESLKET